MQAYELKQLLIDKFRIDPPPQELLVDHETYANVCQEIFNNRARIEQTSVIHIVLGPNNGIMFKKVELILG